MTIVAFMAARGIFLSSARRSFEYVNHFSVIRHSAFVACCLAHVG